MPKIVILGSCSEKPYNVLTPNPLNPKLYVEDHEKAYEEACKVFYPAIKKADVVLIWCPTGKLGDHTWRDTREAIENKKKMILLTKSGIFELVVCSHCKGKGEIEFVDYPASGATIHSNQCGICKGLGAIPNGSKGNKSYNEPGGRE